MPSESNVAINYRVALICLNDKRSGYIPGEVPLELKVVPILT